MTTGESRIADREAEGTQACGYGRGCGHDGAGPGEGDYIRHNGLDNPAAGYVFVDGNTAVVVFVADVETNLARRRVIGYTKGFHHGPGSSPRRQESPSLK